MSIVARTLILATFVVTSLGFGNPFALGQENARATETYSIPIGDPGTNAFAKAGKKHKRLSLRTPPGCRCFDPWVNHYITQPAPCGPYYYPNQICYNRLWWPFSSY